MKRSTFALFSLSLILLLSSCAYGALGMKKQRLKNFMRILPSDIAERLTIDSPVYGGEIAAFRAEANEWIAAIHAAESNTMYALTNTEAMRNDPEATTFATLTNRRYERENPYSLMARVEAYTKPIAQELEARLSEDESLRARYDAIKSDEAIVGFTVEETVFYFLWNYVITIDRPRRFQ